MNDGEFYYQKWMELARFYLEKTNAKGKSAWREYAIAISDKITECVGEIIKHDKELGLHIPIKTGPKKRISI